MAQSFEETRPTQAKAASLGAAGGVALAAIKEGLDINAFNPFLKIPLAVQEFSQKTSEIVTRILDHNQSQGNLALYAGLLAAGLGMYEAERRKTNPR